MAKNVLGGELESCSTDPMTGFTRTGCCDLHPQDGGFHVVCAVMTDSFLEFSKSKGNDLSTPRPEYGFAGLKAGDQWCLCGPRWAEALAEGKAPKVKLEATHAQMLEWVDIADLRAHAI